MKNHCVRTLEFVPKGAFVVQYGGDVISLAEAKQRDDIYSAMEPAPGCYLYYFNHNGQTLWFVILSFIWVELCALNLPVC